MSEPKPKLPSNPSATLRALNAHLWPSAALRAATLPASVPAEPKPGKGKPRGRKGMNDTERAYSLILEAQKAAGNIERWEREGMTLRWPDGMAYSPDFMVVKKVIWEHPESPLTQILFIETKGAYIRDDALVKFRAARAHWPEFEFRMMQRVKGVWTELLATTPDNPATRLLADGTAEV